MLIDAYSKKINGIIQKIIGFTKNQENFALMSYHENQQLQHILIQINKNKEEIILLPENKRNASFIEFDGENLVFGIYDETQVNRPKEYFFIDFETRAFKEAKSYSVKNLEQAYLNPAHYPEDSRHFKTFQEFFKSKWNLCIYHAIEYLELENKVIFSYYICNENWKNILLITNKNFEILHEDILMEDKKLGYISFQMMGNFLFYTKAKNELKIYEIL